VVYKKASRSKYDSFCYFKVKRSKLSLAIKAHTRYALYVKKDGLWPRNFRGYVNLIYAL